MDAMGSEAPQSGALEDQIGAWRVHLRGSRAISAADAEELEDHLRQEIHGLIEQGLSADEAFLVAVKRIGAIDTLTREFAREHSDRLWKQLVLAGNGSEAGAAPVEAWIPKSLGVALLLAVGAGLSIKAPTWFGIPFDPDVSVFYPQNIGFLVLPFIAGYFVWARPMTGAAALMTAGVFVLSAVLVNAFPFATTTPGSSVADTQLLTILHLPIVLWFWVGVSYVGGRWVGNDRRMDFVRFTGELFIYFVLIGLGGGVLIGTTFILFEAIGVDAEPVVENWILPCGFAGATVVATWLVEAKQSVIENMAPVLTRVFAPLFTLLFLAFLVTMVWTGRGIDVEREVLIAFDLLLVVVFGLLLYSISARDPLEAPGLVDWIHLALVATALLVDVLALWAIGSRISDFGFTPNRVAALGENVVLLVNLAGSAWLYLRFLRGAGPFSALWTWQTTYLYALAGWAAVVAFIFPIIFAFQ
jgi:hypothetical protein